MANPTSNMSGARAAAQSREQEARIAPQASVEKYCAEPNRELREEVRFLKARTANHAHPLRFAGCDNEFQIARKLELIREGDGTEY
jgi:hypothetical protein